MGEKRQADNNYDTGGDRVTIAKAAALLNDILQELVRISKQLEAPREEATAKEQIDRIVQSGIEFWKATYDSYKNFTTLSVASVAAFGALFAGDFFSKTTPVLGVEYRILILSGFIGFLCSTIFAFAAGVVSKDNIYKMWTVEDAAELDLLRNKFSYKSLAYATRAAYLVGLVSFLLIIISNGLGFV